MQLEVSENLCSNYEFVLYGFKLTGSLPEGPDAQDCRTNCVELSSDKSIELRCYASELRLRGNSAVVQPHVEDGDVFCWNGEVSNCFVKDFDIRLLI